MEESFPMTGGDGPNSYAKNSAFQKETADRIKVMLVTVILENLGTGNSSKAFCIADLGCSTRPNTFISMENIIEGVSQKSKIEGYSSLPVFQVFFNDHVSNDFNILFANLPSNRKYFTVGIPGSFHGRLFPKATLNFVYSAIALQLLSKAPQGLSDVNSSACNKGRIYYASAPNEVGLAYSALFAKDMDSFVTARAEEIASGGLMAFLIPGCSDGTLPSQFLFTPVVNPLESSLFDIVDEESKILSAKKLLKNS